VARIPEDDVDIYHRYGLRVKDTYTRAPIVELPRSYMIDMTATEQMQMTKFYSERIYSIEITETYLDRLTNDLKHFHEYIKDPSEYREMRDRELNTRKRNPAVQKAWANYKMLLRLAAEGRTLDLD
jgi:hypothetical protein